MEQWRQIHGNETHIMSDNTQSLYGALMEKYKALWFMLNPKTIHPQESSL